MHYELTISTDLSLTSSTFQTTTTTTTHDNDHSKKNKRWQNGRNPKKTFTMSMHKLVLKRWVSFKNLVLLGGWSRDFVRRRGLKEGDEIGLLWDSYAHCFHFSVLKPIHH
ncbi:B3 domain-containing protein [Glycine soja]